LLEAVLRAVCPTVKSPMVNPTSGDTPVKSTHACFPLTHPYTKISVCLSVDLPFGESVKKFTCVSFFTDDITNKVMSVIEGVFLYFIFSNLEGFIKNKIKIDRLK
jgi:hypothetical protein